MSEHTEGFILGMLIVIVFALGVIIGKMKP